MQEDSKVKENIGRTENRNFRVSNLLKTSKRQNIKIS